MGQAQPLDEVCLIQIELSNPSLIFPPQFGLYTFLDYEYEDDYGSNFVSLTISPGPFAC